MKTSRLIITLPAFVLAAAISTNLSHAQTAATPEPASNAGQPAMPAATPYAVVAQDANSAVWERTVYEFDPSGQAVPRLHRYTELATGLNFWKNGEWTPSKEEIDILPNGTAASTQGQHQVYFPGDIAQGVITLNTPEGLRLQSRPIALCYDDDTNTVILAVLTNSAGYLVGSNVVLYPNAFEGADASVRYTYTKAGLEQDILIQAQLPSPEAFGLNPASTRLQVLTEFFDPPQPAVTTKVLPAQAGVSLADQVLDFGVFIRFRINNGYKFNHSKSVPV